MSQTEILAFILVVTGPVYVYFIAKEIQQYYKGYQTSFRTQFSNDEFHKLALLLISLFLVPSIIISFFNNVIIKDSLIWSNALALLLSVPYFVNEKMKPTSDKNKVI